MCPRRNTALGHHAKRERPRRASTDLCKKNEFATHLDLDLPNFMLPSKSVKTYKQMLLILILRAGSESRALRQALADPCHGYRAGKLGKVTLRHVDVEAAVVQMQLAIKVKRNMLAGSVEIGVYPVALQTGW